MDSDATEIVFTPVPITGLFGCVVPVIPGGPDTDAPLGDRSELCAVDANWIVGRAPTCDTHVQLVCELTDIDWPQLVAEAGRRMEHANRAWGDRQRHSQADAQKHRYDFGDA